MAHVMAFGVFKILYIKTTVKTLFFDNLSLLWYNITMSGVILSSFRIFDGGQNWVNVHANT